MMTGCSKEPDNMVRIAFVMGDYPEEEWARRERVILAHQKDGLEIGIINAGRSPYINNVTPADLERMAPDYINAFIRAEQEGYDAVVPFGALDIGVEGGRCAVSIPVIGPCEACLLVASQLGDRFGVLVYHADMMGYQNAIVRRYRMENRICGWRSTDLHLPEIAGKADSILEQLTRQAMSLTEQDRADVIIPLGVTQCPVHVSAKALSERIGVPVVEGISAPLRMASLLVEMGLSHSRKRWPGMERAPAARAFFA
jgi:allantoin racemase